MLFTYIEQKIAILSVNYSPDLLFLIRRKFDTSSLILVCVVIKAGGCFETRFERKIKICKYVTVSLLLQYLWAKDIVDSISTVLCSFLHSDLMCYIRTNWNIFTRKENTMNLRF